MRTLIFVRHGETAPNAERRYLGSMDPPLNARGIEQAETLSAQLRDRCRRDGWVAYASDRTRAQQTARIALAGAAIHVDRRLRELDFGRFDGGTFDENVTRHGKLFLGWIADPTGVRPPDGEILPELEARVGEWLEGLPPFRTVAAFTHAGTIRVAIALLMRVPYVDTWRFRVPLGCALEISIAPDGSIRGPSLLQPTISA
jgi:broad specificity phosphatase PhoE